MTKEIKKWKMEKWKKKKWKKKKKKKQIFSLKTMKKEKAINHKNHQL